MFRISYKIKQEAQEYLDALKLEWSEVKDYAYEKPDKEQCEIISSIKALARNTNSLAKKMEKFENKLG
jgi:hypothetical protein